VQQEGQLSGHLLPVVVENSSKDKVRFRISAKREDKGQQSGHLQAGVVEHSAESEELGIDQARSATKGTAERALTRCIGEI
jgi:hypothetical protein